MFISPMLLHKSDLPFCDHKDSYITELKLDGIRLILTKFHNKVRLYTRHNNEVTAKFPSLLDIDIPDGTVLDGEIIVPGEDGKPDFEAMMERFTSSRSSRPIQYAVFDVLYYKGEKVTHLPLIERKKLLEGIATLTNEVILVQWMIGNASSYFDLVKELGLEGIVMKEMDSRYEIGKRSKSWLKVINYHYKDVLITGYRKGDFGWILTDDDGKYLGIMELGVPKTERSKVYNLKKVNETDNFVYIEPFKTKVKYRESTKKGLLRLPTLA